ncbi:MAG TPA: hypothetical protein VKQ30_25550 [Ktedonobacterales bacterium]|nr:hypothetical protein [Ktedonobacterales bacterium]
MSLHDAISAYHDLLSDSCAADSQAELEAQQHRRGLYFGTRPLTTVLRPRFLTPEQYRFMARRVNVLLRAFQTAYEAALTDPPFRAQFGLVEWEEELLRASPGYRAPSPIGRFDTFYLADDNAFSLIEYNAETPAAQAYNDVLTDVFYGLPIMRAFQEHYDVRPLPARHGVYHILCDAYKQFSGTREKPRVAILDWREVPTYSEFVLFSDYLKSQGLEVIIADPREVEYRNGQLVAGDFTITLVYKRVLLSELVDRMGLDSPVLRAVRDNAVCMVNPVRCKLLHKKASLAVLSDERNAHLFTGDERAAIAAHIPWTRRLEERRTLYHDGDVDLIPHVLAHRERFVLKANDEYGGKGITLGWETESGDWERAVLAALVEPHVIQERVPVPSEPFPSLVNGAVVLADRMLDTDPFIYNGRYVDGCLTRLSTAALLNVTAGGGSTVPTFVVEPR